jgi:hypothetical protein
MVLTDDALVKAGLKLGSLFPGLLDIQWLSQTCHTFPAPKKDALLRPDDKPAEKPLEMLKKVIRGLDRLVRLWLHFAGFRAHNVEAICGSRIG